MSAALALGDALVAALVADTALQAALGGTLADPKVYSGQAPDPDALPYIVVGASHEARGGWGETFGRRGHLGTETLHLWTAGPAKRPVVALYGLVEAALSDVALTMDGHALLRGRTTLAQTLVDQDGRAHHGIVEYAAHTRVTA